MSSLPTPTLSYLSSPRLLGFLGDGTLNGVGLSQADSHPFPPHLRLPQRGAGQNSTPIREGSPRNTGAQLPSQCPLTMLTYMDQGPRPPCCRPPRSTGEAVVCDITSLKTDQTKSSQPTIH